MIEHEHASTSLHTLRRFLRAREPERQVRERCQMCSTPLAGEHRHVLDLAGPGVLCACDACALLFAPGGANRGNYRLIPRRVLALEDFQMTDEQWSDLLLPVNMVYLFQSSETGRTRAFYPSPAGAMESLLDLENWQALLQANPVLNELEPDVEALLINRVEQAREYYLAPIDVCYRLVGLLRTHWKGLSGGREVWEAIASFFAELRAKASPTQTESEHAQSPATEHAKGEGDEHAGSQF